MLRTTTKNNFGSNSNIYSKGKNQVDNNVNLIKETFVDNKTGMVYNTFKNIESTNKADLKENINTIPEKENSYQDNNNTNISKKNIESNKTLTKSNVNSNTNYVNEYSNVNISPKKSNFLMKLDFSKKIKQLKIDIKKSDKEGIRCNSTFDVNNNKFIEDIDNCEYMNDEYLFNYEELDNYNNNINNNNIDVNHEINKNANNDNYYFDNDGNLACRNINNISSNQSIDNNINDKKITIKKIINNEVVNEETSNDLSSKNKDNELKNNINEISTTKLYGLDKSDYANTNYNKDTNYNKFTYSNIKIKDDNLIDVDDIVIKSSNDINNKLKSGTIILNSNNNNNNCDINNESYIENINRAKNISNNVINKDIYHKKNSLASSKANNNINAVSNINENKNNQTNNNLSSSQYNNNRFGLNKNKTHKQQSYFNAISNNNNNTIDNTYEVNLFVNKFNNLTKSFMRSIKWIDFCYHWIENKSNISKDTSYSNKNNKLNNNINTKPTNTHIRRNKHDSNNTYNKQKKSTSNYLSSQLTIKNNLKIIDENFKLLIKVIMGIQMACQNTPTIDLLSYNSKQEESVLKAIKTINNNKNSAYNSNLEQAFTNNNNNNYITTTNNNVNSATNLQSNRSISYNIQYDSSYLKDFLKERLYTIEDSGSKSNETYLISEYAPVIFNNIRTIYGITKKDYIESISPQGFISELMISSNTIIEELFSTSKSGSMFFYTKDGKLIIKSLPYREYVVLKRILPNYFLHLKNNPYSLLPKYYGLYKLIKYFKGEYEIKYFITTENIFSTKKEIQYRFDLKGSTKNRRVLINKSLKQLEEEHINDIINKFNSKIKLDNNNNNNNNNEISNLDNNNNNSNNKLVIPYALKDLDFIEYNKKLVLNTTKKKSILNIIRLDSEFLGDHGLIDYSLLVGIHKKDDNSLEIAENNYNLDANNNEEYTATKQQLYSKNNKNNNNPKRHSSIKDFTNTININNYNAKNNNLRSTFNYSINNKSNKKDLINEVELLDYSDKNISYNKNQNVENSINYNDTQLHNIVSNTYDLKDQNHPFLDVKINCLINY